MASGTFSGLHARDPNESKSGRFEAGDTSKNISGRVPINLPRSAKSASNWTVGDLDAYNISLSREQANVFFGTQHLPRPQIDPEFLNIQGAADMVVDANQELIDLAMVPAYAEESAVEL